MDSIALFRRSMRLGWCVCIAIGCTSSPTPEAQSTLDASLDGSAVQDAAGEAGRDAGDAGSDKRDGSAVRDGGRDAGDGHVDDPNPCEDVDCSALADECNTAACNPDTGDCELTAKQDGTECGDVAETECDGADSCLAGVCEQNHAAAGESCGDSDNSECDHPDTCDGSGTCQDNREPAGTSCGDDSDTECDDPDSCDGAGRCLDNLKPSGTPCGDETSGPCDAADSCDGSGACAVNHLAAGTPCGDAADTECDDPDTCDGAGLCLANHASVGLACGDRNVPCHEDDHCDGAGACSDAGLLAEGSPCGDARNDECRNPDVCDAAGHCQPNDEATGTSCGSCPSGAACACREAACVDRCAGFGETEYGYIGCDDSAAAPPCPDISSTGTALTLAPGASASVDIGFDFTLYGVTRRAVQVYEDGVLSFGDGAALPSAPECLSAGMLGSTTGPSIAPFWTDFASGGAIYYQTAGAVPDRTFSVQWVADHALSGSDQPADVRVELSEAGQRVRVCYVDTTFGSAADSGALAVAGITDAAGADPLAFSCTEPDLPDTTVLDYYCTDGCPFTTASDFDAMQAGDLLAAKSSDWSSWNADPAADSVVVAGPAHSPPNAVRITANTDLVRPFDAGSGGVVVVSAMSYVPSDMTGIMWLLVEDTYYPNGAQHWLSSIWLDGTNDTVTEVGGSPPQTGGNPAPVVLLRDAWVEVRVTIDLGARTYSASYNGQALVTDRTWTLGASGSFRGAVDLFGDPTLTGAGYYDDVTIAKLPAPDCGNGIVEPGEQCDPGAGFSDAPGSACDTTCHRSLIAWLDGSDPNGDGSVPAEGAAVAVWVDKAGRNDAVQADPAKQPLYAAAGLGTGALAFDGLNDFMGLPIDINPWALPSITVVAVFQNAAGRTAELTGVWGNDNLGWDRFLVSDGSWGDGVSGDNGFVPVAGIKAENVPLIAIATLVDGRASSVHVNGRLGASFIERHPAPVGGTPSMTIGNLDGPEFPPLDQHAFDGLIAEIMVFDRALSRTARNDIGSALAAKYGLASYCGDGVTSGDEQCDDGINNGNGCSPVCTSVP